METQQDIIETISKDLFSTLEDLSASKANADIVLTSQQRCGVIQLRKGIIVAAHSDFLRGNGALLSLASVANPNITVRDNTSPLAKTISFSGDDVKKLVPQDSEKTISQFTEEQEQQILEEAKTLFFQFQRKLAAKKLVSLLRSNRFCYPAWLWQSRIFTRPDYISKALDEACRWGSHDQRIWQEARKIRPQLNTNKDAVRRCSFCYSILQKQPHCPHCKAFLCITNKMPSPKLKKETLRHSQPFLAKAYQQKPNNAYAAYVLAICHFNLEEYRQAHYFLQLAARTAPEISLYAKSLTLLNAVMRAHSRHKAQQYQSSLVTQKSQDKSILLVEDHPISQKMLTMLLQRNGYDVFIATNKAKALEYSSQKNIDFIIIDSGFNEKTGYKVLETIKQKVSLTTLPSIILLDKQEEGYEETKLKNNTTLLKPFNPEELVQLIKQGLSGSPQQEDRDIATPAINKIAKISTPEKKVSKQETTIKKSSEREEQETPQQDRENQEPTASVEQTTKSQEQKTVFVIEDSPTSRKVISLLLSEHGFHVVTAENGNEALSTARELRPHLVLLDIMLPDSTGYEILPQLQAMDHFDTVPVLFLTAKRDSADKEKGLRLGAKEYITKPFDPDNLIELIRTYI